MIRHRRYGKERRASNVTSATHLLKIGYNAGKKDEKTGKVERAFFGKLRGFLIFRNETQASGTYPVDLALMQVLIASNVQHDPEAADAWRNACKRLGIKLDETNPVTAAAVKAVVESHLELGMKAPANEIPTRVEFVLGAAAQRDEQGGWKFPGIYDESYVAMKVEGCKGEFCRGDGCTASRWQPDGTRRQIECNPVGKDGIEDASQFCKYSVPQDTGKVDRSGAKIYTQTCLPVGTLKVVLGYRDASRKLVPLSRLANAAYELETRSENAQMRIASALINAANRLDGQIGGISGTLSFSIRNTMAPHHVGAVVAPIGQLDFVLNEYDIAFREQQFRAARGLEAQVHRPVALLQANDQPSRLMLGEDGEIEGSTDARDEDPTFLEDEEQQHTAPLLDDSDGPASTEPQEVKVEEEHVSIETATAADMIDSLRAFIKTVSKEEGSDMRTVTKRLTTMEITKEGKKGSFATDYLNWFTEGTTDADMDRRFQILKMVCAKHMTDPRFELRRLAKEEGAA